MDITLVICRDLASLKWLRHEGWGDDPSFVVASDDLRVQTAARGVAGVQEVSFLERIESFYAAAPHVLSILDAINAWLSGFGQSHGIPRELLYWICHCEGGDTTQRIQDALLLVRSYFDLIGRFQPREIVIIRSVSATWEDDLLVACAEDAGITVRFAGSLGWRGRATRIWTKWRPLAKELYLSSVVIASRFRALGSRECAIDPRTSVMVQLCSPEKKHLNQSLPLIAALDNVGLEGVALCWGAGEAASIIRRDGRKVVELESWVTISDLFASWIRTANSWRHVRPNLGSLLKDETCSLHVKLVRRVLANSMRSFFLGEVAHRYRLYSACRRFFNLNPPRAARLWTRVLPQGVTAYRALPPSRHPLLFLAAKLGLHDTVAL